MVNSTASEVLRELKVKMASQSYQENMAEIQRDYDNVLTQYNR